MKNIFKTSSNRRVSALPWLLLAALALLITSCGDGVTQEEFDAEKARVASLTEQLEQAEAALSVKPTMEQLEQVCKNANEWHEKLEQARAELEQATEALRYTAFYGSSVPLGMSAEDYYHGAMNDLISHAARALPKPPEQEVSE